MTWRVVLFSSRPLSRPASPTAACRAAPRSCSFFPSRPGSPAAARLSALRSRCLSVLMWAHVVFDGLLLLFSNRAISIHKTQSELWTRDTGQSLHNSTWCRVQLSSTADLSPSPAGARRSFFSWCFPCRGALLLLVLLSELLWSHPRSSCGRTNHGLLSWEISNSTKHGEETPQTMFGRFPSATLGARSIMLCARLARCLRSASRVALIARRVRQLCRS